MPLLKSMDQSETPSYWDEAQPLWVSGLAVLCVFGAHFVCHNLLHLVGKKYDWRLYLALGTLFPLLLVVLLLPKLLTPGRPSWLAIIDKALIIIFALAGLGFLVTVGHFYLALLALLQWGLTLALWRRAEIPIRPAFALTSLGVLLVAWLAASRYFWWMGLGHWLHGGSHMAALLHAVIFIAAFALVFLHVTGLPKPPAAELTATELPLAETKRPPDKPQHHISLLWLANGIAIILFLIVSLRVDQLFNDDSFVHWSAVIGSAAMVRQGGWLYWDVPAQYGFLNTLLLAALPTSSVWQSFYILDALLLCLTAIFIFKLLQSLRPGLGQSCFAFLVAFCATFLLCGWPPNLAGPQKYPLVGAFRFFWCYALLAVLVRYARSEADTRREEKVLWLGCLVWVLGSLWSSESLIFCTTMWLPAYIILIYEKGLKLYQEQTEPRVARCLIAGWLALPLLMFSGALIIISGCYLVGLHRLPEWYGFFEYAFSFSGGFFALPMDVHGSALTLLLVFCALSTVVAYLAQQKMWRPLSLVLAAWWALWATSSYFVSRSHENNATALAPILCSGIAVTLFVLQKYARDAAWAQLVKMSFVPVLTVVLVSTLGNLTSIKDYLHFLRVSHTIYAPDINQRLPVMEPALQQLLATARVTPHDPIVYDNLKPVTIGNTTDDALRSGELPAWPIIENGHREFLSPPRTWLPTAPFILFSPLRIPRRQVYMTRFAARSHLSGWLIQSARKPSYPGSSWLSDQLQRTHRPTKSFQNADWKLVWYELKTQPATTH